jgi:hypothetical protein
MLGKPSRRGRNAMIGVLTALVLAIPTAVWASHQFTDVPNSHLFHSAIGWMKDNDITKGCNPPANDHYCPDNNVTRGQMAAFMQRLAENQVVDAAEVDGVSAQEIAPFSVVGGASAQTFPTNLSFVALTGASTSIAVPTGQTAVVNARISGESMCTGGDYATVRLLLDGNEMSPAVSTDFAFDSSDTATEGTSSWESHAVERFVSGVPAGDHTITAQVSTGCTTFRFDDWTLTAEAHLGGSASLAGLDQTGNGDQGR